jgi:hypothetical protein
MIVIYNRFPSQWTPVGSHSAQPATIALSHRQAALKDIDQVALGGVRGELLRLLLRAASNALTANFRRDSARRSYRFILSNCLASSERIAANLCGRGVFSDPLRRLPKIST